MRLNDSTAGSWRCWPPTPCPRYNLCVSGGVMGRRNPTFLTRIGINMPRIVVAECKQEVSSFNPVPSCYEDFRVVRGRDLLDFHRGGGEEMGGALQVFDTEDHVQVVPAFGASANTSGGILTADGFARLQNE